jgi:hypothetical protein
MESCVASVEFQLNVADSPLLTEVGLAWSVTVGVAGAGAGSGFAGGGVTFFGPQPNVKRATASAASKPARQSERETKFMRILLSEVPVFVPPEVIS